MMMMMMMDQFKKKKTWWFPVLLISAGRPGRLHLDPIREVADLKRKRWWRTWGREAKKMWISPKMMDLAWILSIFLAWKVPANVPFKSGTSQKILVDPQQPTGSGSEVKEKSWGQRLQTPKFQNHKVPIKNLQKSPKVLGTRHHWFMCILYVTTFTFNISTSANQPVLSEIPPQWILQCLAQTIFLVLRPSCWWWNNVMSIGGGAIKIPTCLGQYPFTVIVRSTSHASLDGSKP